MKHNFSVVPVLLSKEPSLSYKMALGFLKIGLARLKPRFDFNYNHFKDLGLIYFKLTPLCNLHCKMCGQYGDRGCMKGGAAEAAKTIVPLERYKQIIDEIAPRRPVTYIWGGEPFLYPDLLPLGKHIVDKGLFFSVNTNGMFLEQHAEQIVRDKWSCIFVSLDAFKDVNDAMRGKGSYERVVRGIEAIKREKERQKSNHPFVGIVTTVTNANYANLEEFVAATKSFDIDIHMFNLGTYTNDAIVDRQKKLMKEKLNTNTDFLSCYNTGYNKNIDTRKLYDILQTIHNSNFGDPPLKSARITVPALNPEKIGIYYNDLETPVRDHCIVPWCQANINYNGDVHFCADYPDYILGNIKDQSFKEIYNGERANIFRKTINACEGGMFPGCLRCYQNMLFGKKIKGF
ncbi:MAG: radical SAM protein [Spirochaetaceae bacterium]|jgi:MoaA/NifB/PqqE/SkfB family radical SAM enzyme|nr:radical SAM protein [Spirochaetaceae bacterium]